MAASQSDIGHECTASDLATTDLFKIEATDTCDVTHEQLTERGYDVAELRELPSSNPQPSPTVPLPATSSR